MLGAGATAATLTQAGHHVTSCILSGDVSARQHRPSDDELLHDTRSAAESLGMDQPILGNFPNIGMNTVMHLKLVQFIEAAIVSTGSTRLFTHHPSDLNDDHRQVSMACQAAARISARQDDVDRLESLHFMEVSSSTEWAFPGSHQPFQPTAFFEIGESNLERKLQALACYRDVMRPYPHPRSREALSGIASFRGSQAGMVYAEAFQTAFSDIGSGFSS